jgi:hypothetical protein
MVNFTNNRAFNVQTIGLPEVCFMLNLRHTISLAVLQLQMDVQKVFRMRQMYNFIPRSLRTIHYSALTNSATPLPYYRKKLTGLHGRSPFYFAKMVAKNGPTYRTGIIMVRPFDYSDPPNTELWSVFRLYLMPVPGIQISDHSKTVHHVRLLA